MPNVRAAIALSNDEVRELVGAARTAVLVTIGPDGVPDPVPMWFVLDGDDIVMRTYAKSQKVRNLERDPRVSVLVEDGTTYDTLRGVQLTGRMDVSRDVEAALDVVAGLAKKYEGVEVDREALRDYAAKQAVLRLRVERVASWDHGKIAAARG
jgi:PPOX class probable F420-dependent enzyme